METTLAAEQRCGSGYHAAESTASPGLCAGAGAGLKSDCCGLRFTLSCGGSEEKGGKVAAAWKAP